MKIVFLVLIIAIQFACNQQKSKDRILKTSSNITKIGLFVHPNDLVYLNYFDGISKHLSFINKTYKAGNIWKYIRLNKPSFAFFTDIAPTLSGKDSIIFKSYLLFPGDSLLFQRNLKPKYSSFLSLPLDSILIIPYETFPLPNQYYSIRNGKSFNTEIQDINTRYLKNETKIRNSSIQDSIKVYLQALNLNLKYQQFLNIKPNNSLNDREVQSLDSIVSSFLLEEKMISLIDFSFSPAHQVVAYEESKKATENINEWVQLRNLNNEILNNTIINNYLINKIINSFVYNFSDSTNKQIPTIEFIHEQLYQAKKMNLVVDSLLKFSSILLLTKSDFAKAKNELNTFQNGQFKFLFEDDDFANHEDKDLTNIQYGKIINRKGESISVKEGLLSSNNNIIVLDFWATWCLPCISQLPYWDLLSVKFKNSPVQFVSISIDDDKNIQKWISYIKKRKMENTSSQFKSTDADRKSLQDYLQVNTIPKYVIINSKGKVLEINAPYPDNGNQLENLIEKLLKETYK